MTATSTSECAWTQPCSSDRTHLTVTFRILRARSSLTDCSTWHHVSPSCFCKWKSAQYPTAAFRMLKCMQSPCWFACMPKRGVTAIPPRGPPSSSQTSSPPAGRPVTSFGLPRNGPGSHPPWCTVKGGCHAWRGYGVLGRRRIFQCRSTYQSLERKGSLYVKGRGISPFSPRSLLQPLLRLEKKLLRATDLTLHYHSGRQTFMKE